MPALNLERKSEKQLRNIRQDIQGIGIKLFLFCPLGRKNSILLCEFCVFAAHNKISGMKIPVIELSECTLCGVCEEVAPSVFRISDAGYVMIADLPIYPADEVNEAIKNCPEDCIYWEKS